LWVRVTSGILRAAMPHLRRSVSWAALAVFVLGAGALGGCATGGAGVAKHVPRTGLQAADFYPLTPGWKWAYDLEKDGQKILAVYSVTERTPEEAVVLAGVERLRYAISPAGIAQSGGDSVGDFVLKNPLTVGATWAVEGGTAKVVSTTEEITVDAGHFYDCVIIEVTRSDPMRIARTTFAPDIGPVALEFQVQDGGKFVVTTRARLRSVTRPGEDLFSVSKPR
jgi:hypothetical protein